MLPMSCKCASAATILLALISIIVLSACPKPQGDRPTNGNGSKPPAGSIRIGVVAPLTGEGATYGASMKRGFDLAFKEEPRFTLVYEDDKLSPSGGVTALNKLISADKVKVVLGSAASSVTLAMAPIAESNKVILFSTISTSDDLRKSGEYFFRNVPRNEVQGFTGAEFLYNHLKKRTVAIVKKNDEYGTNLSTSFKSKFEELGGKVVFEEAYTPSTKDFRAIIAKVKKQKPDAIYTPGNYEEVASFLKQLTEAKVTLPILGGDGSYSPELIKIAGNAAEGFYVTMMTVGQTDYYTKFKEQFVSTYNRDPDVYDAYAYEAGKIIMQTIDAVGNDATKIRDYLLSTTFDSVTGPLKFDADGEVDRKYGVLQVRGSKFIEVDW